MKKFRVSSFEFRVSRLEFEAIPRFIYLQSEPET